MVLDVTADETDALRKQQQQKLWDRKKKKFVVVGRDQGIKVRNESGKIVRSGVCLIYLLAAISCAAI